MITTRTFNYFIFFVLYTFFRSIHRLAEFKCIFWRGNTSRFGTVAWVLQAVRLSFVWTWISFLCVLCNYYTSLSQIWPYLSNYEKWLEGKMRGGLMGVKRGAWTNAFYTFLSSPCFLLWKGKKCLYGWGIFFSCTPSSMWIISNTRNKLNSNGSWSHRHWKRSTNIMTEQCRVCLHSKY